MTLTKAAEIFATLMNAHGPARFEVPNRGHWKLIDVFCLYSLALRRELALRWQPWLDEHELNAHIESEKNEVTIYGKGVRWDITEHATGRVSLTVTVGALEIQLGYTPEDSLFVQSHRLGWYVESVKVGAAFVADLTYLTLHHWWAPRQSWLWLGLLPAELAPCLLGVLSGLRRNLALSNYVQNNEFLLVSARISEAEEHVKKSAPAETTVGELRYKLIEIDEQEGDPCELHLDDWDEAVDDERGHHLEVYENRCDAWFDWNIHYGPTSGLTQ